MRGMLGVGHLLRRARVASWLAGLLVLATLGGCAVEPAHPEAPPNPRLAGEWWLISGRDAAGNLDVRATLVTLTIGARGGGRTPCNDYRIELRGSESLVFPRVEFQRKRLCATVPLQDLEVRYIAALETVRFAGQQANNLTLSSDTATLEFSRAARVDLRGVLGRTWEVHSISGPSAHQFENSENVDPSTLVIGATGGLRAVTACRVFEGSYTTDAGEMLPTRLRQTVSPCTRFGSLQDADVMRVLENPFTVAYYGGLLILRNQRGGLSVAYKLADAAG
jgi:heat shock protein HslJ